VLAGTATSYLYGLFDVGEDVTLRILLKKELIRSSDASVAAAFTLGKLLTISLSIFGVVIFLMLSILLRHRHQSAISPNGEASYVKLFGSRVTFLAPARMLAVS
jgi:hypothetical protein